MHKNFIKIKLAAKQDKNFDQMEVMMKSLLMLIFWGTNVLFGYQASETAFFAQLHTAYDSCVVDVVGDKCYLNPDNLYFHENKLCLSSDIAGEIVLPALFQDDFGIYTFARYCWFLCNNCRASYKDLPPECTVCGGTDFTLMENLPAE